MYWYGIAFVPANLLFMSLGVLLYVFAAKNGIAVPAKTDDLFPLIATQGYLPQIVTVFFMLGLIAAAYSSADSALTSLTTSFSIDILEIPEKGSKLSVRLLYRGISPKILKMIPGEPFDPLPVVEMDKKIVLF